MPVPKVGAVLDATLPGDTSLLNLLVLVAFVAFGLFSWRRGISFRVSIIAGLVFLVIAAFSDALGQKDARDLVAILAYYSLVVGVSLAIVEHIRGGRAKRILVQGSEGRGIILRARLSRFRTIVIDRKSVV